MDTEVFARYVIPVDSKPLENSVISISGGRIKRITAKGGPCTHGTGYGAQLVIPGLVNAHTHLDLTDMAGETGRGEPFTGWIRTVIAWRKKLNVHETGRSIKNGVDLSIKNGTTCIGDYSSSGASFLPLNNAGIKGRVFLEVTGLNEDAASEKNSGLVTLLSSFEKKRHPLPGIAPHAPYSVSAKLVGLCSETAAAYGIPVSMHAGETYEETEFLKGKAGCDMEKLLEYLNVRDPGFKTPFKGAVEYLNDIGVLKGMTLVHLNFITPYETKLLSKAGCSAVFCPGSHIWFNRKRAAPIYDFAKAGINIALGTDGLSSNDSLCMLREMRLMKKMFPEIPRDDILRMATINGARALSLDNVTGSLAPGKDADLVGISSPEPVCDPLDLLFDENVRVSFVISKGKLVYGTL